MREFPRNREAEVAILGNAILNPDTLRELDGLSADHFYEVRHQNLYRWLMARHAAREPIDTLILADAITGNSERFGGLSYATSLPDNAALTDNVSYHAAKVIEAAQRRTLIAEMEGRLEDLYNPSAPLTETLATLEASTRRVSNAQTGNREWTSPDVLSQQSYDGLIERAAKHRRGEAIGLPTSIPALDKLLGGLRRGKLYIVGGRPGMGKTSFALGCALAAAMTGAVVGFVSREMSGAELWDRLVSILTGINGLDIRDGIIEDDDRRIVEPRYWRSETDKWSAIEAAYEYLGSLDLYVAERARTQSGIRAASLRLHARNGLDLLLVDYLQRVKGEGETLPEKIGSIPIGCKTIAKDDLNIPVMLLTQLNRGADGDGTPSAASAKGSGDIEQEADALIFPIREIMVDPEAARDAASIHVPKNRGGDTGKLKCGWCGPRTQYYDLEHPIKPFGALNG